MPPVYSSSKEKKIKSNKGYEKRKAKESNSKELKDSLVGTEDNMSSARSSTSTDNSTTPLSDPLQLILARLDLMQAGITALETSKDSAVD